MKNDMQGGRLCIAGESFVYSQLFTAGGSSSSSNRAVELEVEIAIVL